VVDDVKILTMTQLKAWFLGKYRNKRLNNSYSNFIYFLWVV